MKYAFIVESVKVNFLSYRYRADKSTIFGVLIFFPLKWDHYFIFGFLCLIKPDSNRISTLEPFISQKMGYYTVYVSHLGFLSPESI